MTNEEMYKLIKEDIRKLEKHMDIVVTKEVCLERRAECEKRQILRESNLKLRLINALIMFGSGSGGAGAVVGIYEIFK
jgi:hypothetical protein